MKIVVVIPTFNESQNIGRMIDSLEQEFKLIPNHQMEILVVDGNSPDGTGDIVNQKAQTFSNVHLLLEKQKAGIGAAYFQAFDHAMKNMGADALMELDADFQHDPADVKRLVAKMDEGYDYVIGSRFTKGGAIPSEWAFYRKFLSVGGNIFTKIVLGVFSVNDFTSGFKLARVKGFADSINYSEIMSKSFAYKVDLTYRMHNLGARIAEVPIQFGLRDRGNSKIEKSTMFDTLFVVLRLRFYHNINFFKFLAVGVAGLVTDYGLFILFRSLLPSTLASNASGFVAMMTTFLLNNFWSFKGRSISNSRISQGVQKALSSLPQNTANLFGKVASVVFYFASSYFPIVIRSQVLIHQITNTFGDNIITSSLGFILGVTFGLVWNYTIYSKIIWTKSK